jgi:hypothetical protein
MYLKNGLVVVSRLNDFHQTRRPQERTAAAAAAERRLHPGSEALHKRTVGLRPTDESQTLSDETALLFIASRSAGTAIEFESDQRGGPT